MSTWATLCEHVRDGLQGDAACDERADSVILRGRFSSRENQAAWLALAAAPPHPIPALQVYDTAIGGDVGAAEPFDPNLEVTITVVKPSPAGAAYFFFQDSIDEFLANTHTPTALRIADLPAAGTFVTRGLGFAPWLAEEPTPEPPQPLEISPTKLVADYVPARELAPDLSLWLLRDRPAQSSRAFEQWQMVAARRLLGGLVSSAFVEGGCIWLQASGPPIFRVRADDPELRMSWEALTDVATWVFLSGADIEARHRLFGGEFARAGRLGEAFAATLARAFAAAKAAYDAHVQSSSRETLKALADLRKTVIEETQKVTQRAQDMTAALGRDLAVSAAPFVLKILADAGKVAASGIAAGFYFAAALFLAISFALQWRINDAFLNGQKQSRSRWMQTLYPYISDKEREEIADAPITQALQNYRETRAALLLIYIVLCSGLIIFGGITASQPVQNGHTTQVDQNHPAGIDPPNSSNGASAQAPSKWWQRIRIHAKP